MKTIIMYLLLLIVFVQCKSTIVQDKEELKTTTTIQEVVHDTIFKIEKDSSYYQAFLRCKENKVVLLSKPKYSKGIYIPPPVVKLENNRLQVDCKTKALEWYKQWRSQHKTEVKEVLSTKYIPVEKKLTWWQKTCIRSGKLFFVVLMGGVVWGIFKIKNLI